ncbi:MAG: histidine phosphatase family protein [Thermoanaerobaculia bacterium]
MNRLILIRHGETLDNLRGVAQGWRDSALSPQGETQVAAVAGRLREVGASSLWCSTLPRARTTAEAISREIGLEPKVLDDLKEMNCGDWEGVSFLDVRRDHPELYRRWASDPHEPCPGGESFADVRDRMERAIEQIRKAENGSGGTAAVVSHGTAIRVAATSLLDLPLDAARRLAQDNAALNIFEWRAERWVLKTWNDSTHCSDLDGK